MLLGVGITAVTSDVESNGAVIDFDLVQERSVTVIKLARKPRRSYLLPRPAPVPHHLNLEILPLDFEQHTEHP